MKQFIDLIDSQKTMKFFVAVSGCKFRQMKSLCIYSGCKFASENITQTHNNGFCTGIETVNISKRVYLFEHAFTQRKNVNYKT